MAERIGEIGTSTHGLKAKIIEYGNADNIVVQFENGVKRKTTYLKFKRGYIKCPMIYKPIGDYIECENPNIGLKFLIDKEELNKIEKYNFWSISKGSVVNNRNNNRIALHRLIKNCPKDKVVDHINGNTLDNRKCNLRICTQAENSKNKRINKNNTSGYKGVFYYKRYNKWTSIIMVNGKKKGLGYFDTPEEAYAAYCKAAKELHGEFANTG